jgi:parallel beta-helix repeat protein
MKIFLKENWYKLMIGSSMLITSFGFMIYAISPSYANNNLSKKNIATYNDDCCIYVVDSKNNVWVHGKGENRDSWYKTGKTLE